VIKAIPTGLLVLMKSLFWL